MDGAPVRIQLMDTAGQVMNPVEKKKKDTLVLFQDPDLFPELEPKLIPTHTWCTKIVKKNIFKSFTNRCIFYFADFPSWNCLL